MTNNNIIIGIILVIVILAYLYSPAEDITIEDEKEEIITGVITGPQEEVIKLESINCNDFCLNLKYHGGYNGLCKSREIYKEAQKEFGDEGCCCFKTLLI